MTALEAMTEEAAAAEEAAAVIHTSINIKLSLPMAWHGDAMLLPVVIAQESGNVEPEVHLAAGPIVNVVGSTRAVKKSVPHPATTRFAKNKAAISADKIAII